MNLPWIYLMNLPRIYLMNLSRIGPMSSYKLLDKGSERDGPDLGRTPGHDVNLQEHVRQLRRRAHHQTE